MTRTFTDTIAENHAKAKEEAAGDLTADHWIGGASTPAAGGERFETRDPAVDEPIAAVARGSADDVDAAVAAARRAVEAGWPSTQPAERAVRIREWADEMRAHAEELALLESLDGGKPFDAARDEVATALDFFEYYAAVARSRTGETIPAGEDAHVYTRREPYGVAGQILPWNYPVLLFGWKTGAALAAGNAVVVKPAEQTPLSTIRAAQLSADVLPDGVLNVVAGYGEAAGAPLVRHPDVDKLSFTGSVPVGRSVMRAAADSITPVTLELGGKNPFVVFADADVEAAAAAAAAGIYYNAGQSCDAAERVIVHASVHDRFVDAFLAAADGYAPGDPLAEGTAMGPLCFRDQFETVREYVEVGREEGATLLRGGDRPDDPALDDGHFLEPTVFDGVDNDMRIAQEEIFGPVQTIQTFEAYEEAIERANGVQYGLAAGVFTGDPSLAHRAAADIEAGSVWVNRYFGTFPGTPFGGFKQSGIGRECAAETLDDYAQTKAVNVALDDPAG